MTSVRIFKTLAAFMALVLMLSLCSLSIFADEPEATAPEGEATAAPETTAAAGDETTAAPAETTAAADDDAHDHGFPWDAVISFGIVIIAIAVLLIIYFVNPKFKEKVQNFFRSIKSELKKVVWSSKNDVKKNTIVVLIFVAAFAVLIGLLDFLFSKGIIALGKLW